MVCAPTNGMRLLGYFIERLSHELLKVLTVARLIWAWRNNFVFNRGFTPPRQIMEATKSALTGFSQAVILAVCLLLNMLSQSSIRYGLNLL
jgi:hypothetical protein